MGLAADAFNAYDPSLIARVWNGFFLYMVYDDMLYVLMFTYVFQFGSSLLTTIVVGSGGTFYSAYVNDFSYSVGFPLSSLLGALMAFLTKRIIGIQQGLMVHPRVGAVFLSQYWHAAWHPTDANWGPVWKYGFLMLTMWIPQYFICFKVDKSGQFVYQCPYERLAMEQGEWPLGYIVYFIFSLLVLILYWALPTKEEVFVWTKVFSSYTMYNRVYLTIALSHLLLFIGGIAYAFSTYGQVWIVAGVYILVAGILVATDEPKRYYSIVPNADADADADIVYTKEYIAGQRKGLGQMYYSENKII